MGSDLYRVTASKKKDKAISLDIDVIHPDAMYIPADPSFALLMLHEAIMHFDASDCPLAREASFDDMLDSAWMTKYAKGFVRGVKRRGVKKTRKTMSGTLDVTVADTAWISHIDKGASWESRSFSVVTEYDDHDPISPSSAAAVTDGEDGLVWIPREYYMSWTEVDPKVPALLEMPAYAESCYTDGETIRRPSRKQLESWLGRAAIVIGPRGREMGSIAGVGNGEVTLAQYRVGGGGGFGSAAPESIARPVLKAGRRGSRVDVLGAVQRSVTRTTGGKKSGTRLELALRIPPDGRTLPFDSITDALHVLVLQAIDPREDKFLDNTLCRALQADLEQHEMDGTHRLREIYPFVAKNYIARYELDAKKTKPVKLDGTSAEIRAALDAPWPTATLVIEVTDAKWFAHFDPAKPVAIHEYPHDKPTAAPKKAPPPVFVAADARAVLVTDKNVWIGERRGNAFETRSGSRTRSERKASSKALATPEKAQAELDKAVRAKLKSGYKQAPARDVAAATVWKRLGFEVDDASGKCVVTKLTPALAKAAEYKLKDVVEEIAQINVSTIEEIAAVIAKFKDDSIYVSTNRPASGTGTMRSIPLG